MLFYLILFLALLGVAIYQFHASNKETKRKNRWLKKVDKLVQSSPGACVYLWKQMVVIFDGDSKLVRLRYLDLPAQNRDIPFSAISGVEKEQRTQIYGKRAVSSTFAFTVKTNDPQIPPLRITAPLQQKYPDPAKTDALADAFSQLLTPDAPENGVQLVSGYCQKLLEPTKPNLVLQALVLSVLSLLSVLTLIAFVLSPSTGVSPQETAPAIAPSASYPSISYSTRLVCGHYTAGVDFPAGDYDITVISGRGNVSSDNSFSGGVNEVMGETDDGFYISSFHGAALEQGVVLSVGGTLMIEIQSDAASGAPMQAREQEIDQSVKLSSGNWVSGTDFPAGVYDIECVSGSGNISSDNLWEYGINEMIATAANADEFYITSANNISLPEGTELTLSGVTVKLTPST